MNNLELPQLLPHRFSTCDLHPHKPVTGFCATCLRQRLGGLDPANATTLKPSTSILPPSSSSSLKAILRVSGEGDGNNVINGNPSSSGSSVPELRRSKTFSGGRGEGLSGVLEPKRKSCDVRVRSTLWDLFNLDSEKNRQSSLRKHVLGEIEQVKTRNLVFSGLGVPPILESKEEDEEEEEIRVSSDDIVDHVLPNVNIALDRRVEEIEEEQEEKLEEGEDSISVLEEELKTMKDHIDLELQSNKPIGGRGRDLKEISGSFRIAASVFSKKLQKWRKKQKMKKHDNGGKIQVEQQSSRHFKETQLENADNGFGRRSCDTDPRFCIIPGRRSLDAGRRSFDDPRYSWDEPRASWDGYLIGRVFPRIPPMVSVTEDRLAPDNQIPFDIPPVNGDVTISSFPHGSLQTKDCYSDSMKRNSLGRSSSVREMVAEVDETKSISNSKVSPTIMDHFNGTKTVRYVRDSSSNSNSRDSNSNSLRDDSSESFDMACRDRSSGDTKGLKKSHRWSKALNIWEFINRRR